MIEPLTLEEQRATLVLLHDTLIRLDSIKTDLRRRLTPDEYYNFKVAKEELRKFVAAMYQMHKPIA
jgi:hypothetical protein